MKHDRLSFVASEGVGSGYELRVRVGDQVGATPPRLHLSYAPPRVTRTSVDAPMHKAFNRTGVMPTSGYDTFGPDRVGRVRVVGRYVHGNGTLQWSQLGAQPGDSVVLVVPVAKVGGATRASLLLDASVRRATVRENGTTPPRIPHRAPRPRSPQRHADRDGGPLLLARPKPRGGAVRTQWGARRGAVRRARDVRQHDVRVQPEHGYSGPDCDAMPWLQHLIESHPKIVVEGSNFGPPPMRLGGNARRLLMESIGVTVQGCENGLRRGKRATSTEGGTPTSQTQPFRWTAACENAVHRVG